MAAAILPIGRLPLNETGVTITAATVTILIAEYIRRHRVRYPLYGWLGIVCVVGAEWLMFGGVEPVATFFTPIVWSAYILIVDAAVFSVTGRSRLRTAPLGLLRMAGLSIPLWLIFEAYNLRLQNWTYDGVPKFWPAGMIGYAWSFATIMPAIFETADLIQAFLPFREWKSIKVSRGAQALLMILGALTNRMHLVLWILAVVPNITVIQRIVRTWQQTKVESRPPVAPQRSPSRPGSQPSGLPASAPASLQANIPGDVHESSPLLTRTARRGG